MQRGGRGGRDDFFGDPFGGFGGFGGFGNQRSLVSSFFGGRDPFDDPFFNRPFGNMFGSSMFGPTPSIFGDSRASGFFDNQSSIFGDSPASGFIDNRPPQPNQARGPIIEEINSDNEGEDQEIGAKDKRENPRKHSRSSQEPYVEDPDDGVEERRIRHMSNRNNFNRADQITYPQNQSYSSFHSSTVTYGGANGAYYTSSTTRRAGSDGVILEEKKEADTTTGKAEHRISRGIHNKGHSVTRKLESDGKVDTLQTLHNLNENELPSFEEDWKGKARKHLPGWDEGFNIHGNIGPSSSGRHAQAPRGGWALPSTEKPQKHDRSGSRGEATSSKGRA